LGGVGVFFGVPKRLGPQKKKLCWGAKREPPGQNNQAPPPPPPHRKKTPQNKGKRATTRLPQRGVGVGVLVGGPPKGKRGPPWGVKGKRGWRLLWKNANEKTRPKTPFSFGEGGFLFGWARDPLPPKKTHKRGRKTKPKGKQTPKRGHRSSPGLGKGVKKKKRAPPFRWVYPDL